MDRGAWQATVHEVARVTKPPSPHGIQHRASLPDRISKILNSRVITDAELSTVFSVFNAVSIFSANK